MTRHLKTISQFANETAFTEPQLRWWIFQASHNGLNDAGAVVRVGPRRVYIDVDGFDAWLRQQNPGLREVRA